MTRREGGALLHLSRPGESDVVTAVVSRRAAALRLLRVDGIDLVEPTTALRDPPGMAGAILAPWPNRVEDASWWLDGRQHRLAVTEPGLGHANHGLLTATDFAVRADHGSAVTLGAAISEPAGYPFTLDVEVAYTLDERGIGAAVTVRNLGDKPAPVALGAHPYLRIGDVPTAALSLRLDADHAWPLDERHVPVARVPATLAGVSVAVSPRHATYESSMPAGALRHTLTAPDGRRVTLTADAAHRFTQLWIPGNLASDDGPREAIAIEPMTAPPNALRTGVGLRWIARGVAWTAGWRIDLSRAERDSQPEELRAR